MYAAAAKLKLRLDRYVREGGEAVTNDNLAWFAGDTAEVKFALGGSFLNYEYLRSQRPSEWTAAGLTRQSDLGPSHPVGLANKIERDFKDFLGVPQSTSLPRSVGESASVEDLIVPAMEAAVDQTKGPVTMVEFVAKGLYWFERPNAPTRYLMLGTPLYVAMAD